MIAVHQGRVTYELDFDVDKNSHLNPENPAIVVPRDITAVIRAQFSSLNTVKIGPETDFSDSNPDQISLW
jgi:hypothetical protein